MYVCWGEKEYGKYVWRNGDVIKVGELREYWKGKIYGEGERGVYEEDFIKGNVWKRKLKVNEIRDLWKGVVGF